MTDPESIDISVIVPCYNHGQFVREAIHSVEASRGVRFEVIVVDDASTDERTLEVMTGLRRDGYRVIRHEANQGVAAARNTGIAQARGRFILPLDADNRIRPDYLRLGVTILDHAPRVGVVYGDMELFGETTGRRTSPEFSLQRLLLKNSVDACAVLRRATWEDCGGYDPQMPEPRGYEDWELWLQAAKRGWEFVHIGDVMFDYRVRPDSLVRACEEPETHSRLVRYLVTKHRDLYAAYLPEILAAKELDLARERAEIARMKSSAFWRSRDVYVRVRRLIHPNWS